MRRIEKILQILKKPLTWFAVCFLVLLLSVVHISFSTLTDEEYKIKEKFFNPVIQKLLAKNIDSVFINHLLADPSTQFNEKYVKFNVTGFLKKADYSSHHNQISVKKSLNFLQNNLDILSKCEKTSKIPKEVITSILWIETRHGNYLGGHHIPSVFLSTAMAENIEYINMNKEILRKDFKVNEDELKKLELKIEQRAAKKSKWAINEIVALEKIYKNSQIEILDLYGSWAGAFGMSQFLPSSYTNWAVDGNGDGKINLFEVEDAIYSVANYLKINGWGNSIEQQRKAVFHYNNSNAYVDAVLLLAEKIKKNHQSSSPLEDYNDEIIEE
jgi:membrane-bound lytic murein transglycosylase B